MAHIKEDHGMPIYGVAFNDRITNRNVFATCGVNRVTIYDSPAVYSKEDSQQYPIRLLKCYADPDPDEYFFTCSWSYNSLKQQIIAAAGQRGIIRIINIDSIESEITLVGHGGAVNELKFHSTKPNLLLSCSKDLSLRLWSIADDYFGCVAMFGGVYGHRGEVLSADFHISKKLIVSAGMDHALKIWNWDDDEIDMKIKNEKGELDSNIAYKQQSPIFSTRDIHYNYVDSVKYFGDLIMSKSSAGELSIWMPGSPEDAELKENETKFTRFSYFSLPDCLVWFIKFDFEFNRKYVAVGNTQGIIYLLDLNYDVVGDVKTSILKHPKCKTVIRECGFSRDGKILISVADDGTVWRWDIKE